MNTMDGIEACTNFLFWLASATYCSTLAVVVDIPQRSEPTRKADCNNWYA